MRVCSKVPMRSPLPEDNCIGNEEVYVSLGSVKSHNYDLIWLHDKAESPLWRFFMAFALLATYDCGFKVNLAVLPEMIFELMKMHRSEKELDHLDTVKVHYFLISKAKVGRNTNN